MHPILNIAVRTIRKASNLILQKYDITNAVGNHQKKDDTIYVYQSIKCLIINSIHEVYPHHHVLLGEEYYQYKQCHHNDIVWIVNPLDGVNNFTKHFPHFAISIAVLIEGQTKIAVVYDPIRNELFTSVKGQGARLNGYRLRAANIYDLNKSIIATNFCFHSKTQITHYNDFIKKLCLQQIHLSCTGSEALDFAYLSAGRINALLKVNMNPWNICSGELLIKESGGLIMDFNEENNYLTSGNVLAGASRIVKKILSVVVNR